MGLGDCLQTASATAQTRYRVFAPGIHWGTSVTQTLWTLAPPPEKIPDAATDWKTRQTPQVRLDTAVAPAMG